MRNEVIIIRSCNQNLVHLADLFPQGLQLLRSGAQTSPVQGMTDEHLQSEYISLDDFR